MKSSDRCVSCKANWKTMGSTTIDGSFPAKTGPRAVTKLDFRGANGRATTRPETGR
jgi:hypothetical protein